MIKIGDVGPEVKELKLLLIKFGYMLNPENPHFLDKTDFAVREFQKLHGLKVDGVVGPITLAKLYVAEVSTDQTSLPTAKPFWLAHLENRIGWTEFSHNKEIAKDWPLVGLPQYKSVIGSIHAWCGLAIASAMNSGGIKPVSGAAGARNWSTFGERCDYISGAIISMRHKKGGNHVTCFLYWVDEDKKLAACLGGNQANAYKISTFNLSGNKAGHDEVIGGPRWPTGYPKSGFAFVGGGSTGSGSESTR